MHIYLWQIDPLLKSSIDAMHTTTPNLAHLIADQYIYRTMHIYLCQIDPPPIEHRSLQNHYTTKVSPSSNQI